MVIATRVQITMCIITHIDVLGEIKETAQDTSVQTTMALINYFIIFNK